MEQHLLHRAVVHWEATQTAVIIVSNFFALLVSELRLCVVNAAPSESRWWRFTADYRTGFTDKMRMEIGFDLIVQP